MLFLIEEKSDDNSGVSTDEDAWETMEDMGISCNVHGHLKSCRSCYLYQLMA